MGSCTVYGIFEDLTKPEGQFWPGDFDDVDRRCKAYWQRFAPEELRETCSEAFLEDPVGFIDEYTDEYGIEYGHLAFLQECIAADPACPGSGIQAFGNDTTYALGVCAREYFPWELEDEARLMRDMHSSLADYTTVIAKHAEALYGTCPPFDTKTIWFDG